MSNPTDPSQPQGDRAPDAPTEAYPGYEAPTQAYGTPDAQPTEAYPPAGYGQQPAYGQPQAPAYGQPPAYGAPAAPSAPDTRPKGLAWAALGTAVAGLVLVLIAFIPLLWVSFALAIIGGILLLVGLVLGIIALAKKTQGGKGLGIGAIVVSVLGGGAWVGALVWSLLLIGLSTADSGVFEPSTPPAATQSEAPTTDDDDAITDDTETDAGDEVASGGEAAYIAEVRPVITELMQEVEPGVTQEMIDAAFSDSTLVALGEATLMGGEAARDAMISSFSSASGGLFTDEQATRLFDTVISAAEQHLAD